MANESLEAAIKRLEDSMVVMAHMEARQTERQLQFEKALEQRTEWLLQHEKELQELSQTVVRLKAESAEFQRRTDQNLAEITDKLNGLIGIVDGQRPS